MGRRLDVKDKSFQSVETANISRFVRNPDVLLRVPAVTCPRTYDRLIEFTKAIMAPRVRTSKVAKEYLLVCSGKPLAEGMQGIIVPRRGRAESN